MHVTRCLNLPYLRNFLLSQLGHHVLRVAVSEEELPVVFWRVGSIGCICGEGGFVVKRVHVVGRRHEGGVVGGR